MLDEKKIGVVAGAGPFAGLDLLKKILEQTVASRDQDHLPVIGWFQPALIGDRTAFLLDPGCPNPGFAIGQQAIALAESGAVVVAIPCNTAHAPPIFAQILACIEASGGSVHFLNMIEETAQFLSANWPQLKRVGVLSTTGTYLTRIYPATLEPLGWQVIVPSRPRQESAIHPAVYDPGYGIKACGGSTARARHDLEAGIEELRSAGAEAIILGCTEMPLAFPESTLHGIPLIDPTLALARALIRHLAPEKLKPWPEPAPDSES